VTRSAQALEQERRWAVPAAVAALIAVALIIAAALVGTAISGDGNAEVLRSADGKGSSLMISGVLQMVGYGLWLVPLLYLFRAAAVRTDKMRGGLLGAVIISPVLLGVSFLLLSISVLNAAHHFTDQMVGGTMDHMNSLADDAINDASLRPLALGLGAAGRLGVAFAMAYTCLYAMRTGLLTRFWGSMGMAVGVAVLLLTPFFATLWFVYLGFLILGFVPGGRPPAWAAGEAVPWPTPGERMAAELDATDKSGPAEDQAEGDGWASSDPSGSTYRRKRKRRS